MSNEPCLHCLSSLLLRVPLCATAKKVAMESLPRDKDVPKNGGVLTFTYSLKCKQCALHDQHSLLGFGMQFCMCRLSSPESNTLLAKAVSIVNSKSLVLPYSQPVHTAQRDHLQTEILMTNPQLQYSNQQCFLACRVGRGNTGVASDKESLWLSF